MSRLPGSFRNRPILALGGLMALAVVAACHHTHDTSIAGPSGGGGSLNVSIGASTTSGRAPIDVAFTSDVHGGSGTYLYLWTFGDGTTSAVANPHVQFRSGGTFDVRLQVTAGDQTVTTAPISLHFDSDVRLSCAPDTEEATAPASISFRAAPSGGNGSFTYRWDFGDGASSTDASPNHTYGTPGTYLQTLTVTSGGASAACSNLVTIDGPFHVSCKATPAGGNAVQFHATPTFCVDDNCNYNWDFGGSGSGSGVQTARPLFTYFAPGTYTAKLSTSTKGTAVASCQVTVTVP
jgi:PKD repeat protein